jgi:hypothetical protein
MIPNKASQFDIYPFKFNGLKKLVGAYFIS